MSEIAKRFTLLKDHELSGLHAYAQKLINSDPKRNEYGNMTNLEGDDLRKEILDEFKSRGFSTVSDDDDATVISGRYMLLLAKGKRA